MGKPASVSQYVGRLQRSAGSEKTKLEELLLRIE